MLFQGKNVLITGTARGIGKELVLAFAREGANVFAHARKYDENFEAYLKGLQNQFPGKMTPLYFDMRDREGMKKEIRSCFAAGKVKIDILINNAGIIHGGFFQMTPMKTMREVFDINFFAVCELTQLIVRLMARQKEGVILNMASVAGLDLEVGNCAYGTSKAAVIAFTKTLSAEVAPLGIRVNAVAPGLTDTDMAALVPEKTRSETIRKTAFKRMAKKEEIVAAVLFLASHQSSFITGQVLRVDGGM